MNIDSACLKYIIRNAALPGKPADPRYQLTCVFFLIFFEKTPRLLAILKSDTKGYPWRNQIAFPGGHVDKMDTSPRDAAFRELKEELNISRQQVEFIGSLGHFQTINLRDIEAFIGIWNRQGPLKYDTHEIARVLDFSLEELIQIHIRKGFQDRIPSVSELVYALDGVRIWGVSARILHHFIELWRCFNSAAACSG